MRFSSSSSAPIRVIGGDFILPFFIWVHLGHLWLLLFLLAGHHLMPAIALILARAGSKGVPGKNTAPIAGKPCISWTFDFAQASPRIDHVVLSTDDPSAKDLARSRGIAVIDRPPNLATDTARVDDATRHAVTVLESKHPALKTPDTPIFILYANIPVRPAGIIEQALDTLPGADSVQSYQPVGKNHPWWTARLDPKTHEVRPWEGEVLNHSIFRRQELPPAFVPDGGILLVTRRALFLEVPGVAPGPHAFFGKARRGIISPGPVIDIDTRIDALVADAMLREPLK